MQTKINEADCTGCEACVTVAPEVYEMGADNIAKVKVDPVPADQEEAVRTAASDCPATCIEVIE